ncbi:DNA polymerase III subunit gamma/tau [Deinococcus soli (ex Cha et al. 2016)]|uniref:DNA polymerase-3 subunit gamma/tau n=2 Tax=Deinococcus soli (ex Cha et al. 2016) TaxID=1309411 RepID=A0ACC6KHL8_9DEIO|nr:DNA polymerase III subunit gamma/tau [Deinococcus soli (ex Cha et al. 2016)]MDR6218772.1 DNA polymerase-3 subunit gamma/tau [Deinococcus soli (ex Cha et al. 2016)]MDR6328569.1 DNA polymerase-3 subunit gamma/tau [Deinococcus soli (ex Cha et al. 2016)]MDR6751944.1 DNA polymerase-3 subunit gamma/tau [Deinococcus soli (ex Cha et al. 2016)]
MSAIYQRARPIRWDDIVGQEHVKDVLKAALEQGRVGHAYLFSGPRGVGKTTTARLIAMTANCTGPLPKPCGECESCLSVRAGSHPDVMEIDAASNNSVDDVRDLREKVGLAAMRGGKKIYILDEAHMMSRAAFNALLKTLEEPPGHVIFILATTEPEKIIPTVLSRCQHYRFRRLTPEEISGKLAGLAQREGADADADALALLGRLADGAMRDGESLLERMLAAGTAVTRAGVEAALGLPPGERVRGIAAALVTGDAGAAFSGAATLYRDGFAARTVVDGLVSALAEALHAELGIGGTRLPGADIPRLLNLQAALDGQDARFARSADQQSLELALTHALLAADRAGPAGAVPGDMAARVARLERDLAALRGAPATPGHSPAPIPPAQVRTAPDPPAPVSGDLTPAPRRPAPTAAEWADVVRRLDIQMRAFLKPAHVHLEAGLVRLTFDARSTFQARLIAEKFDRLGLAVAQAFGPVRLELDAGDLSRTGTFGQDRPPAPPEPARQPAPPRPPAAPPAPPTQPPRPLDVAPFQPNRTSAPRRPQGAALIDPPEPITQEPTWDDLPGGTSSSPKRSAPERPSPAPTPRPAPAMDAQNHPNFQEITSRFPGRIRDAGVKRSAAPTAEEDHSSDEDT